MQRSHAPALVRPLLAQRVVDSGPGAHARAAELLSRAILDRYAPLDGRDLGWPARLARGRADLEGAASPEAFAEVAAGLLAVADDPHLALRAGGRWFATHTRQAPQSWDARILAAAVPGFTAHGGSVATGRFPDGIAYVLVAAFPPGREDLLAPALDAIEAADASVGLILDVRPNPGGDELQARALAGLFVEAPAVYALTRAPDLDPAPPPRTLLPTPGRRPFRGEVAVLQGPRVSSSGEALLLMMKQAPRARRFGERSAGSSGNPAPVELGNGVALLLPRWRTFDPSGVPLEGQGVAPDEAVVMRPGDAEDPVLGAALRWLRRPPSSLP